MDSELVGIWKRTLEIQGFGTPAENVLSAVARISAESDHCKDGWKDARQKNKQIKIKMKQIIRIQVADAATVAKAILSDEGAEVA
jgi:hypothetical protein